MWLLRNPKLRLLLLSPLLHRSHLVLLRLGLLGLGRPRTHRAWQWSVVNLQAESGTPRSSSPTPIRNFVEVSLLAKPMLRSLLLSPLLHRSYLLLLSLRLLSLGPPRAHQVWQKSVVKLQTESGTPWSNSLTTIKLILPTTGA